MELKAVDGCKRTENPSADEVVIAADPDNVTLEVVNGKLQVKNGGVNAVKLADDVKASIDVRYRKLTSVNFNATNGNSQLNLDSTPSLVTVTAGDVLMAGVILPAANSMLGERHIVCARGLMVVISAAIGNVIRDNTVFGGDHTQAAQLLNDGETMELLACDGYWQVVGGRRNQIDQTYTLPPYFDWFLRGHLSVLGVTADSFGNPALSGQPVTLLLDSYNGDRQDLIVRYNNSLDHAWDNMQDAVIDYAAGPNRSPAGDEVGLIVIEVVLGWWDQSPLLDLLITGGGETVVIPSAIVVAQSVPVITYLSATSGFPGDTIDIYGSNFGSAPEGFTNRIDGLGTAVYVEAGHLQVTIDPDAPAGTFSYTFIAYDGGTCTAGIFTVLEA